MNILGISAFYHDSAACLLVDGTIAAAAQEERFTRKKHDSGFPTNAARYCLSAVGLHPEDLDYVVFYDKPFLKFERIFETYLAFAPRGFPSFATSLPIWFKEKLFQKSLLAECLKQCFGGDREWLSRLHFSEHHLSHAASAFFPSPFENAAILTIDGVGEWTTTSVFTGRGSRLSTVKELQFPHSLGLLYSAFTYYTGFKVNSGEYKVMGLAPYGEPRYERLIRDHLIDLKEDGTFHLNMEYFDYCTGLRMTSRRFHDLFGGPPRDPESLLTQRDMDLAASIQAVAEDIILRLACHVRRTTNESNLCLAGGVALNCVANGALLRTKIFDNLWIQPAAGDAGGALGAALALHHIMLGESRVISPTDSMHGALLGPEFSQRDIERRLSGVGASFDTVSERDLINTVATAIAEGNAVGWMQGRMEFGPRALGARSILADPRSPTMQKQLNLKVKYRESFRPFAPSVLREDLSEWFDLDVDSPYMLLVADVIQSKRQSMSEEQKRLFGIDKLNVIRSEIPAVTHLDYSARIHTVTESTNPRYFRLLSKFKDLTGCPVLVNTSFNVRGEPIICTPEDAFHCFMGTGLDLLAVGNSLLWKTEQNLGLAKDYKHAYELD